MDQVQQETSTGAESLNNQSTETTAAESQGVVPAKEEAAGGISGHIAKVAAEKDPVNLNPTPAFSPNFKYKVVDKEHEFDEFIRGAIKNADHEKKVRELYEKAAGIEHIKGERERIRNEYKAVNEQYSALNKGLDSLSTMLRNKDYHGFINALKIPEQDILQYALSRVQYKEMPPEQRQKMDAEYEAQQRLTYLEQTNQELLQNYQNQRVQQRTSELDGYLGRPEVSQIASQFDTRVGKPGAFRDEVIRRGQYYASLPEPQDVTVEQAVREIMTLVGASAQTATPAEAQTQMESPQASFEPQTQKPVIPNIKGRGTSPARKVVSSIADLRKMHASME